MKAIQRYLCALLLVFACVPMLADDCPTIQALTANDVQTGEPVTFTWSYTGDGPHLQVQTLTGHDFETPVILGPNARSYTYLPSKPGQKHAQLSATTTCGTVTTSTTYQVKQCNVVAPPIAVDQTSVEPGAVIQASINLKPGHTVRWEVINGTASSTTGSSIQVTAGDAGWVAINAWVSRGSSCSVLSSATVQVVSSCPIVEPSVYHPDVATADNFFYFVVNGVPADQTVTFDVHGTTIDFQEYYDGSYIAYMTAPPQDSFTVDVTVGNGSCSRTFTYPFTVEACHAAVVVKPGQTAACGYSTAIAEFSGTPPFQGSWSDGEWFFTYDSTIERPISGGNYTISWFWDQYCPGTVTGSVNSGSSLPKPSFTIDEIVGGYWWGLDTCPGTVRTATLNGDIPAGATLEWSIPSGTILSGQGTPVVQYAAGPVIGPTHLTAVFHDAQGCDSAPAVQEWGQTMAPPQVSVRVEPSTIPAGGTANVFVEFQGYFTGGFGLTSSLGDTIQWNGTNFEYRSTHGGGLATITVNAENSCGSGSGSTTLTIDGGNPVQATARVSAIGADCNSYAAMAELTGVAPFQGTWSNGQTFTTSESVAFLYVSEGGTYTLTSFSDANGAGTITGSATFEFTVLPKPEISLDVTSVCPNGVVTATLTTPLPEGATPNWYVWGGQLLSGQGTSTIQIQADATGWVGAGLSVSAPGFCSPYADPKTVSIQSYAQQPLFDLYGVFVGGTTQFYVYLDPNTTSWGFENSFGDPMEIIGNPEPNVYTVRYTSTHGFGESFVRVYGTTSCGLSFENTRVMNVLPPAPTVSLSWTPGATCGATVTATFTGTPPFSGTWWDGQTFTTNEYSISRFLGIESWVYVYGVSDFYGGNAGSQGIDVPVQRPPHIPLAGNTQLCLGQQTSVTADLPPGWQIQWRVVRTFDAEGNLAERMRIVGDANSATVVVEGTVEGVGSLNPIITTPEGCINYQSFDINVTDCP